MARVNRSAGRNRDLPQIESINLNASSAGGISTDYEHPIVVIPNLASGIPAGASGLLPLNSMTAVEQFVGGLQAAVRKKYFDCETDLDSLHFARLGEFFTKEEHPLVIA